MKKVLLGTSALALLAAAPAANAAEFDVNVGGYFEAYLAYSDADVDGFSGDDFGGVDAKQDAEIIFKPTITLDNGLKIGADIQLEGNTSGDQIDESFVFIKGSFGEFLIGNENSAGYKMSYGAPDVTFVGVNSGSLSSFVPFSGSVANAGVTLNTADGLFRQTLGSTFIENGNNNDAARFTYFTPRFAGFQLGLSYARDGNDDSNTQVNNNGAALSDIFDVGVNYVNSFGDFDVAISGRWGIATDDRAAVAGTDIGEDAEVWGAGVNLGFAGVTIGGSFAEQNNSGANDGTGYDVGISYETGPWGFSFTYMHGENVDDETLPNAQGNILSAGASGNDEELDQFLLGVSYKLAKGVKLNAFGAYVDFDEDSGDTGGPNAAGGDDVDGFVIGTGIKLSF